MRTALLFALLCTAAVCKAQDDVPDTRSKRDNLTKIQEKDIQADVAVFAMAGLEITMDKLPLKSLVPSELSDSQVKFDSGNIHISINAAPFVPTKHKLLYSDKYLIRIDNHPYFGAFTQVPKMKIEAVNVVLGEDTVAIPPAAYNDLYDPNFTYYDDGDQKTYDAVYFSNDKHTMYIYLLCKDNKGGYEVTWVIRDKKFVRRIVDFNILKN